MFYLAAVHHHDAVRHRQSFFLIVRDIQARDAELLLNAADFRAHVQTKLCVEVRERFVHQKKLRTQHEHAGQSHALLFAARQLARIALFSLGQPHESERLANLGCHGVL